ncbi:lamin tail domain-containing protein [Lutibacter citreus]|uniref:lamin tail domain-containing protein n=1 Tax=Lutibacter citreus TaxID=2138210 RepID=UPI000DBE99BE|nr:lamin tail domain-containing protein [Lutibacter citreus]
MKNLFLFVVTAFVATISFGQTDVFINEIHYENSGGDINEGIEIAGPAGTDLTGWSIDLYNNSTSMVYATISLSGTIPDLENGRGTLWFPESNIQNETEALSLINSINSVVQFISYEGVITAIDGVANGMTSIDIGVFEDGTDLAGKSLQLSGLGVNYEDFIWLSAATSTPNLKNNGQTFSSLPFILSTSSVNGLDYVTGLGPSVEGVFNVSGENLTNNIVITSPINFEISETSGGGWTSTITLVRVGASISTTAIYVRLKSGLSIGSYTQEGLITSSDAVGKNISLTGIVSPNVGSIIITEIMQNPDQVNDSDGEYFEVYNTTASDIDMQGWVISDAGSNSYTIGSSVIVPSNGYAVFARNSDSGLNGGFTANYEYSGITLGNADDEIILTNGIIEIDRVHYSSSLQGISTELHLFYYDGVSNDSESNWGSATSSYGLGDLGTPGAVNDFGLSVVKNQIENFAMYPNPVSNGILYMSSSANLHKKVEIYNIAGQQVYNKNVQLHENLNISNLSKGFYIVRIEEEGKIATRKLIVE